MLDVADGVCSDCNEPEAVVRPRIDECQLGRLAGVGSDAHQSLIKDGCGRLTQCQ